MNAAVQVVRDRHAHALLVFSAGRTVLRALALHAPPVRVVRIDKGEQRELTPLTFKGKPYPLARAVRRFSTAGRAFGMTKSARIILKALREQAGA